MIAAVVAELELEGVGADGAGKATVTVPKAALTAGKGSRWLHVTALARVTASAAGWIRERSNLSRPESNSLQRHARIILGDREE